MVSRKFLAATLVTAMSAAVAVGVVTTRAAVPGEFPFTFAVVDTTVDNKVWGVHGDSVNFSAAMEELGVFLGSNGSVDGHVEWWGPNDVTVFTLTVDEASVEVDVSFAAPPSDDYGWSQLVVVGAVDVDGLDGPLPGLGPIEFVAVVERQSNGSATAYGFDMVGESMTPVSYDDYSADNTSNGVSASFAVNLTGTGDLATFVVSMMDTWEPASKGDVGDIFLDVAVSDGFPPLYGNDNDVFPGGDDADGDNVPDVEESAVEDATSSIPDPYGDVAAVEGTYDEFSELFENGTFDFPTYDGGVDVVSLTVNVTAGEDVAVVTFAEDLPDDVDYTVGIAWSTANATADSLEYLYSSVFFSNDYNVTSEVATKTALAAVTAIYYVPDFEVDGDTLTVTLSLAPEVDPDNVVLVVNAEPPAEAKSGVDLIDVLMGDAFASINGVDLDDLYADADFDGDGFSDAAEAVGVGVYEFEDASDDVSDVAALLENATFEAAVDYIAPETTVDEPRVDMTAINVTRAVGYDSVAVVFGADPDFTENETFVFEMLWCVAGENDTVEPAYAVVVVVDGNVTSAWDDGDANLTATVENDTLTVEGLVFPAEVNASVFFAASHVVTADVDVVPGDVFATDGMFVLLGLDPDDYVFVPDDGDDDEVPAVDPTLIYVVGGVVAAAAVGGLVLSRGSAVGHTTPRKSGKR